jgi:hypothetical protein
MTTVMTTTPKLEIEALQIETLQQDLAAKSQANNANGEQL